MSIRLENSVFTTEVTTKSEYDQTSKTYKVTGTLVWSPDTSNNGQSLYCDVTHPETLGPNNPQTVSLQLTVQGKNRRNSRVISLSLTEECHQ